MTNLDQFESTFKSADKARFSYESISLQKLLLVTDGNEEKGSEFRNNVEQMLTGATGIESLELSLLLGDDFDKISTRFRKCFHHSLMLQMALVRKLRRLQSQQVLSIGTERHSLLEEDIF